jgi:hypothetical protein
MEWSARAAVDDQGWQLEHEESDISLFVLAAAPLPGLNILVLYGRLPWNADGIAASREWSHDVDAPSNECRRRQQRSTAGPRRAAAYRPSLVPEAVNLTRTQLSVSQLTCCCLHTP